MNSRFLFCIIIGNMKDTESLEIFVTPRVLYKAWYYEFEKFFDYLPVSVFLEWPHSIDPVSTGPGRDLVGKLIPGGSGKWGIWYSTEEYDSEYGIYDGERYSFVDIDGNFYCSLESTELEEHEREEIRSFVMLFKDEIRALADGRYHIFEFQAVIASCRCRCRNGDFSLCTKEIKEDVLQLKICSLLTKKESGLPVNIVLDVLGLYRVWDSPTYDAKGLWFQKNKNDEYSSWDGFWVELDERLAATDIRDGFYADMDIRRKERSEIRAFITNNALLLSCLCDVLDTGVDIAFFRENFLPGGLLRKKSERRMLERKVKERVMEYRAGMHFKESYRYSLTYYKQKGSGDPYRLYI